MHKDSRLSKYHYNELSRCIESQYKEDWLYMNLEDLY